MEPITLTATAIATLAFQKFLETGAGELSQKFTTVAIAKMDELRQKIWDKLRGNSDAENALKNVEQGVEEDLSDVATYLKAAMKNDPQFASEVQTIAQEINTNKLQNNNKMEQNIYDQGTGIQVKGEGKSTLYVAKDMHIHGKDT